jgi:hypothetical protein
MLNITKDTLRTKTIALMAVFIALYTVLRILPSMPMVGSSGDWFSVSDVIAPIYGLILGPYVGGLSVIIGTFTAMVFGKPVSFMLLDFLPATVSAVSAGLIVKKKWMYAIGLNVVLFALFLVHPNTSIFVDYSIGDTTLTFPFAWLHIVALAVLVSPLGRKIGQWVKTKDITKIGVGVALLFFIGTMMQHLMGNLLFETIKAQPIGSIPVSAVITGWSIIFPLYPVERLVLIIFGTMIGVALVKVFQTLSFPLGDSKEYYKEY